MNPSFKGDNYNVGIVYVKVLRKSFLTTVQELYVLIYLREIL